MHESTSHSSSRARLKIPGARLHVDVDVGVFVRDVGHPYVSESEGLLDAIEDTVYVCILIIRKIVDMIDGFRVLSDCFGFYLNATVNYRGAFGIWCL